MPCSHSAGFGVMLTSQRKGFEGIAVVVRRLASTMALLAALASSQALGQVNIDQGKAPAQIYDSDCAACHKSIRGLANGRSGSALTAFLSEHYTSSAKEAAELSAYVLAGGGGVGTPAAAHAPKVKPDSTTASVEEPKDREAKDRDAKDREVKRPPKPETEAPKPQRPSGGTQKPEAVQTAVGEPTAPAGPERKPPPGRHEPNAGTGTGAGTGSAPGANTGTGTPTGTGTRARGPQKPAQAPPAAPRPTVTVVVTAPAPPETPTPDVAAPAPADAQPTADTPIPRDDIPD
jgi:hypothetical protein